MLEQLVQKFGPMNWWPGRGRGNKGLIGQLRQRGPGGGAGRRAARPIYRRPHRLKESQACVSPPRGSARWQQPGDGDRA